jgi:hypothetical protein
MMVVPDACIKVTAGHGEQQPAVAVVVLRLAQKKAEKGERGDTRERSRNKVIGR